jgi:hypothetical protein
MSSPPHRALRIVLGFLSFALAIGGVLMIASGRPFITRMFLHPPEAEISTLLLFVLKEMAGFALMLSVMLFLALRDPVRNVAIVDAVIWVSASSQSRRLCLSIRSISEASIPGILFGVGR